MEQIEIQSDQIILREEAFDGLDTSEFTIGHEEADSYQLILNTGGPIALNSLIEVKRDDTGRLKAVVLNVNPSGGQSKIEQTGGDGDGNGTEQESDAVDQMMDNLQQAKAQNKSLPARSELPPIPNCNQFPNKARSTFYNRLVDKEDSQPAIMRRIIYSHGELTRQELVNEMKKHGYKDSGSLSESLTVLEEDTGELKRHGRGDNARIEWIGGQR